MPTLSEGEGHTTGLNRLELPRGHREGFCYPGWATRLCLEMQSEDYGHGDKVAASSPHDNDLTAGHQYPGHSPHLASPVHSWKVLV